MLRLWGGLLLAVLFCTFFNFLQIWRKYSRNITLYDCIVYICILKYVALWETKSALFFDNPLMQHGVDSQQHAWMLGSFLTEVRKHECVIQTYFKKSFSSARTLPFRLTYLCRNCPIRGQHMALQVTEWKSWSLLLQLWNIKSSIIILYSQLPVSFRYFTCKSNVFFICSWHCLNRIFYKQKISVIQYPSYIVIDGFHDAVAVTILASVSHDLFYSNGSYTVCHFLYLLLSFFFQQTFWKVFRLVPSLFQWYNI